MIAANIVAKPESADQLRALLALFAVESRKESGCHEYGSDGRPEQPGRFLTFERWTGHPALEQHMKTSAIAALVPKHEAVLAKPFTQTFLSAPRSA